MSRVCCQICTDEMRADNYTRHMNTHIRAILAKYPAQHTTNKTNGLPVVYYQSRQHCGDYINVITPFAVCLCCGASCQAIGANTDKRIEYVVEPLMAATHQEPTKCEIFIAKHNKECTAKFSNANAWYDFKKPCPKLPVIARKVTATKAPRKTLDTQKKTIAPAPVVAPVAPVVAEPDVREIIAEEFPNFYPYFNYDSDNDEDCESVCSDDSDAEERLRENEETKQEHREERAKERKHTAKSMIREIAGYYEKATQNVEQEKNKVKKFYTAQVNKLEKEVDDKDMQIRALMELLEKANKDKAHMESVMMKAYSEIEEKNKIIKELMPESDTE